MVSLINFKKELIQNRDNLINLYYKHNVTNDDIIHDVSLVRDLIEIYKTDGELNYLTDSFISIGFDYNDMRRSLYIEYICKHGLMDQLIYIMNRFEVKVTNTDIEHICISGNATLLKWILDSCKTYLNMEDIKICVLENDILLNVVEKGHFQMITYLVNTFNITHASDNWYPTMSSACRNGQLQISKFLATIAEIPKKSTMSRVNLLYNAVLSRNIEIIKWTAKFVDIKKSEFTYDIIALCCEQDDMFLWINEYFQYRFIPKEILYICSVSSNCNLNVSVYERLNKHNLLVSEMILHETYIHSLYACDKLLEIKWIYKTFEVIPIKQNLLKYIYISCNNDSFNCVKFLITHNIELTDIFTVLDSSQSNKCIFDCAFLKGNARLFEYLVNTFNLNSHTDFNKSTNINYNRTSQWSI